MRYCQQNQHAIMFMLHGRMHVHTCMLAHGHGQSCGHKALIVRPIPPTTVTT